MNILVVEFREVFLPSGGVVHLGQELPEILGGRHGVQHVANLLAKAGCRPTQMRFEHLAHVHAGRHAQRIQDHIDRGATGTIMEMTPLLPWRPAILSPGWRRRFTAR